MVDLLIVLFLIIFWVISSILKQAGKLKPPHEESSELKHLFRFPQLDIVSETLKQENKKIEHQIANKIDPEQKSEAVKTETVIPKRQTKVSKFDSGKLYQNMLKSKTSLRYSIIIKEILDSPVSLR